jgi:hypothetical protein
MMRDIPISEVSDTEYLVNDDDNYIFHQISNNYTFIMKAQISLVYGILLI